MMKFKKSKPTTFDSLRDALTGQRERDKCLRCEGLLEGLEVPHKPKDCIRHLSRRISKIEEYAKLTELEKMVDEESEDPHDKMRDDPDDGPGSEDPHEGSHGKKGKKLPPYDPPSGMKQVKELLKREKKLSPLEKKAVEKFLEGERNLAQELDEDEAESDRAAFARFVREHELDALEMDQSKHWEVLYKLASKRKDLIWCLDLLNRRSVEMGAEQFAITKADAKFLKVDWEFRHFDERGISIKGIIHFVKGHGWRISYTVKNEAPRPVN
jgi:hypothetical protein